MTRKVTATEAKAKILGLLNDVAAGEDIEIEPGVGACHSVSGRAQAVEPIEIA
jgi:hypothetical protein